METKSINNYSNGNFSPGLIKAILLFAGFLAVLNETYLNIVLKNFMEIFLVPMSTVQWLTTGFMLVMTIVVPISAFFIQRFTTRQIFLTTMTLIILGTFIGGCAQTFWMLLIGRLIQAAGTCVLMALLTNTILVITPMHERGSAMGIVGLVVLFAPAIAPTFAGVILQGLNWRWLFFALLPFLVLVFVFGAIKLRNVTDTTHLNIDILSVVLSTIGFGGVLFGISTAGEFGITMKPVVGLVSGFCGIVFFVWRQLIMEKPLLDVRVFRYPMFTLGVILLMISMMMAFAVALLTPMFLGGVLGLSDFATGLAMLPGGLLNGLTAPVAGKIFDRVGPRYLAIPGIVLMIIMSWLCSLVSSSTSIWIFILLNCCMLMSIAAVITSVQTNGLNQLPRNYYSHGTAIMLTLQQLAGGLGTVVFVGIMSINQQAYLKTVSNGTDPLQQIAALTLGFNHAFQFGAILLVLGLIASLFVKRSTPDGYNQQKT